MPKPPIDPKKCVVLTGAGISAPSGISTFRDKGGLWTQFPVEEVATADAWTKNPSRVLEFYNLRRTNAGNALPNDGHRALAALEREYDVTIFTQNVDDLHERAGSSRVIHFHGELKKARSSVDPSLIYEIGDAPIQLGDLCAKGSQLRPHIVFFGEDVFHCDHAAEELRTAGRVLVVGTSLSVFPVAGLVKHARDAAVKVFADLEPENAPYGFSVLRGSAEKVLPALIERWLAKGEGALEHPT